jgi:hypothetical protein
MLEPPLPAERKVATFASPLGLSAFRLPPLFIDVLVSPEPYPPLLTYHPSVLRMSGRRPTLLP